MRKHWNNALLDRVIRQFKCDLMGYHGPLHWANVRRNGLDICRQVDGADWEVVELFAIFHDACRHNEYDDPDHGRRGASLAMSWRGRYFDATDDQMEKLVFACCHHSNGTVTTDPTVGACWDADRYDLQRLLIEPRPEFLSHKLPARPQEWFLDRSRALHDIVESSRQIMDIA